MFSFHRPRVYRSSTGCCICKAKSSSSRFTDSKKYEEDFLECFKLSTRRQGEICNACVLLVKRWKKLPVGSDRNWQHVVDARAGPGIKSMTKFKAKNRKMFEEKFKLSSSLPSDESVAAATDEPLATVDDELEQMAEEAVSGGSSRTASPAGAASDPETADSKSKRYEARRRGDDDDEGVSGFVDPHYWKRETVCCGTVFKGLYGEIMIDRRYYKPCQGTSLACAPAPADHALPPAEDKPETKAYSDSSSDSGYDESSNQSALLVAAAAAIAICEDAEEGVVARSAN